jgi:formate dehydrogenase beta subunit
VSVPGVEARTGRFPGPSLIPRLNEIQARHGWLPREELVALAREARRPLYEIQGLISFYPHYRNEAPAAPAEVAVCRDLSCWLEGGEERIAELRERYGDDADVRLLEVSCLGRCDHAPALAVNDHPAPVAGGAELVDAARAGRLEEARAQRSEHRWPNDPYTAESEHYGVLRSDPDPDDVLAALRDSELRGMGGAGFPTGRKWQLVAQAEADEKYVICNADESEPGTFKDRQLLADQPHLLLEALVIAMRVVGARKGYVFVRHEYGPETEVLRDELATLRASGLLGDLEVEVFVSPGGYILGEETALIECMEGHRGEPRNKPPFPGGYGLWGRPTLMNNVETLAAVPIIVRRGAEWWRAQGSNGGLGLKFFAVTGHVARPGVYCVPLGTTIGDLIEEAGGMRDAARLQAVQPGGASSNFLGPDSLDVPLDFDPLQEAGSMLGSGALVVVAEGVDLLAAATNVLTFFRNESCGKCVPCRAGSHKAVQILNELLAAGGGPRDVDERIAELEETMRLTSICGLGQVALGPVMSVVRMAEAAGGEVGGEARGDKSAEPPATDRTATDGAATDGAPPSG